MRVNVKRVLEAWGQGKSLNLGSISTDGNRIFSYSTVIVERLESGAILSNTTKYSSTTSQQQNSLRAALGPTFEVDGVRQGARNLTNSY